MDTRIITSSGAETTLAEADVEAFKARLHGDLLIPGDADYDNSRTIWNAMIDRRPALIVRCRDRSDVTRAVDFARDNGLLLSIRGGGHNIAGNAVCEGGTDDRSFADEFSTDRRRRPSGYCRARCSSCRF